MSKVEFAIQLGVEALDTVSGLRGTIVAGVQLLNGCVQYVIQPKCKKGDVVMPDGYSVDEASLRIKGKAKPFTHEFKFQTGDRLLNMVNGHEGIAQRRVLDLNGCERYIVEGNMDKDNQPIVVNAFKQEWKFVDEGLNEKKKPVERARTGGPARKEITARIEKRP